MHVLAQVWGESNITQLNSTGNLIVGPQNITVTIRDGNTDAPGGSVHSVKGMACLRCDCIMAAACQHVPNGSDHHVIIREGSMAAVLLNPLKPSGAAVLVCVNTV
jgi:hypothetical protein